MVGFVIIITLGNFGISIAPFIAIAGAAAFGATMAIQGPLSNYGAGLSIILGRPFTVGNTVALGKVTGVVEKVSMAVTVLIGEDGERIVVPNKEIVGRVIVNSEDARIVETRIAVGEDIDLERTLGAIRQALAGVAEVRQEPPPQVGIQDFAYGGVIIGLRFWVASKKYFDSRYRANEAVLVALKDINVALLKPMVGAVGLEQPSGGIDDDSD